jgi:glycine betaine/proline transport system permease protein
MSSVASRENIAAESGTKRLMRRPVPRWVLVLGVILAWVVVWAFTRGHQILDLGGQSTTSLHRSLNSVSSHIQAADHSWYMVLTHKIADVLNWAVTSLQSLISVPKFPRVTPQIGWLGVLALASWVALALAGWRIAILVALSFGAFGWLGFWSDSMDSLIITGITVFFSLVIGIPLAVWMANSPTVNTLVTPVLDVLQTLPGFVYLLPLFLFYGIGAPPGIIATLIYAIPPVIRIASVGMREVSPATIEATTSMGQTTSQRIRKVQLPMARSTVVVGINQTTMAALSMATIAAFISSPGLGVPVIEALQTVAVGKAFVPGLAIVIMAIMLDRTTTAISERSEKLRRAGGGNRRLRFGGLAVAGIVALFAVYLSRTYLWAANFPSSHTIGTDLAVKVQSFSDWVSNNVDSVTSGAKNQITNGFLNPLQDLLANSPWWLTGVAVLLLAGVLAGIWGMVSTVICLGGVYFLGLWHDTMITLATTLVATVLVMLLGVVFGVWMGRSRAADGILRPILDAGQTMPPFVYLIPAIALFNVGRFTAIVAAIIYAAPAAIKLIADGIRNVSETTVEAATAAGSSRWQIIAKVQLPMARSSLVLAANQGLLYVLSMVVIGGAVGGGALGYDVISGFVQASRFGKGLAAGLSVVLLGVLLDRITRRAAFQSRRHDTAPKRRSRLATAPSLSGA